MGLPSCGGGPPQCRARFRAAYAASALTVLCLAVKGPLGFTQPMKGGQLESQPRQLVTTRAELTEVGPAELEAAIRSGPVVLDVYAVWCGPCKMLEPTLEKLAEQLSAFEEEGLQVPQVLRMDSDQHSAKATSLGVEGLPTVIFFKGGAEVARLEGAVGLSQLEEEAAAAFGMELAGAGALGASGGCLGAWRSGRRKVGAGLGVTRRYSATTLSPIWPASSSRDDGRLESSRSCGKSPAG
ncbi:unnamed protein product [Effrenium voratum]|nr:unnamed protein product [Effrenium voratum]